MLKRRFAVTAAGLAAATVLGVVLAAQAPRISNARLGTRPAERPFTAWFRAIVEQQQDPAWIGYSVPAVAGDHRMCCADSWHGSACCGACRLERAESGSARTSTSTSGPVALEASDRTLVLFRAERGQIGRVRVFSADCELDAGGRPVVWIENVRAEDSLELLQSLTQPGSSYPDRVTDGAVMAIALHAHPSADRVLESLLDPAIPERTRKKVTFWLGQMRGAPGLELLRRTVRTDPSTSVRKGAVFGISESPVPDALPLLIDVARNDDNASVRGEAIFWLAQKAGDRAAQAITERIAEDPDTDVKKRAVFALSQLPADQGVPLLIEVARTNTNPAVRKQAFFWLGQSRDPRALDFLAEILK